MQSCWSHHRILLLITIVLLTVFGNFWVQRSAFKFILRSSNQIPEKDLNTDEIPDLAVSTEGDTREISVERNQVQEQAVLNDSETGQLSKGGNEWSVIAEDNTGRNEIPEQSVSTGDSDKTHLILMWHWPIFRNPFSLEIDVCKKRYGVPNCIMVANRSRFPEADFVVFHNLDMARRHEELPLNLTRPEKQRWIWFTRESPLHNGDVKHLNGYFNLTMTYRRDSDAYSPYGKMVPKDTVSHEPLENFIPKNKTKLACWVVSNFKRKHVRTAVYKKLKTVIPIEVYGRGGNRRISKNDLIPTISQCYFYLTFENSVYKDYITEKLWNNAYMSGAVPVVLGPSREDYEAVTDKDSFIHVNDFKTVEELGEFLKELAQDKERYASYFSWRRKYKAVRKLWPEGMCKFCLKMNSLPPHKVYEDLDAWQKL